ncbi:MAG: hypothetical protein CXR30_00840 [Geobacter sp.]|nr:MAG: hypothetical protein CXR30_00840 [Geobacter sp.]
MLDLDPDSIQVDDVVDVIQGAVLPKSDLIGYRFGNLQDEGKKHLSPVHIFPVDLDILVVIPRAYTEMILSSKPLSGSPLWGAL